MVVMRRAPREDLGFAEGLVLDADQAAVLANGAPVLRVLGAPGTGKSALAVEIVADRVRGGLAADSCLILAPTRLGAARLREAVTARLGGTTTEPLARTPAAFGFALLRQQAALVGAPPPRLLSGPEQDVVLKELLDGHRAAATAGVATDAAPDWPEHVLPALSTRGFRHELRDLLMRAVEHGIDAADLARLGREQDRPEWVAAARVLDEYDQVTALSRPGAYDPAWIISAAADLLEDDPVARARAHAAVRLIVVDDAQELTRPALRLLRLLAGDDVQVILLADPDSAVQTFRGADPRLLFDPSWSQLSEASTLVLGTAYRTPEAVHAAVTRVARRIGVLGRGVHRAATPARPGGEVEVALVRSTIQEASFLAAVLRRAHLQDGMPWREMAVIVRGSARAGTIRRVLATAGVPVATAAGAVPVRDEPAARALLSVLRISLRLATNPEAEISPDEATDLLLSPLGGSDAVRLRRLRRALRRDELDEGGDRTGDELLAAAICNRVTAAMTGPDGEALRRISAALAAGVAAAAPDVGRPSGRGWAPGVSAESVLWAIWSGLGVARAWQEDVLRGRPRAARADRDLDAVVGLFDAAVRYDERLPGAGPERFLEHILGEELAEDTLAARAPSTETVAVLTPAAAAGRQWRLVVIAGLQEGVWPDLRLRGSLLGSTALVDVVTGRYAGVQAAASAVRHDETRLLHVALSRASERVVLTAVRNDDEQPSVYLDVVDPLPDDLPARSFTVVPRPLHLPALVGELRRAAADDDPAVSERAARWLARLAVAGVRGAHPQSWWAAVPAPDGRPRRLPEHHVSVSPSKIEQFQTCGLRWALEAAGGQGPRVGSATIGTLVHAVIRDLGDADADALTAEIDRRWPQLGLPPGWVAERQREEAHRMAVRVASYFQQARAQQWELVGAEAPLRVTVGRAVLTGSVDRLERHTEHGGVRVIDYKTGASKPKADAVATVPQLGAYQVAVEAGAFPALGTVCSGAALLHIGKAGGVRGPALQLQPPLAESDNPGWAHTMVQEAADGMGAATMVARPGDCTFCAVRTSCPAQPEGQAL